MNRSVTASAALILAAALAGCSWFSSKEEQRKTWTAEQYYNAAREQLDEHNWEQASKLYEELESKYPYGRYAQQAQLDVAYAYYKQDDIAQAVSASEKFVKLHPNHPNVDYALYIRGLANFREDLGFASRLVKQDLADRDVKSARESFEVFKELVTRFPDSRYAADSRERMAYLVEALARHEVKVARYYMARGAYLAAANRAQDCIVHFPHSAARRDALEIMIEAYDRMGLKALRDDTRSVLAKNYPDDPLVTQGHNRSSSWWKFWD
ncbi:MAG TPA: outer membrane protein assembly factor BamD [Usitatibacter sp.]|nr:outer membrane protein assembly factor BamD [Usitatibacter sp.]